MAVTFGDLRAFLSDVGDEARQDSWEELVKLMEKAHKANPEEIAETWLPYALDKLDRWPDRLRYAPLKWVNALIRDDDVGPLLALAKGVNAFRMTNPRFQAMCESPNFAWVRHLRFSTFKFKLRSARALRDSDSLSQLESIAFWQASLGAQKTNAVFGGKYAPNLRNLEMYESALFGHHLQTFTNGTFEKLETIRWVKCNPVQGIAQVVPFDWEILTRWELPALKTLDLSYTWQDDAFLDALMATPWLNQLDELILTPRKLGTTQRKQHRRLMELTERVRELPLRPEVLQQTEASLAGFEVDAHDYVWRFVRDFQTLRG